MPLPCEVRPQAVLDTVPWLEPVAGMCASGAWGAAVLGPHTLRLFRGGPRMLVEYGDVHDDPPAMLGAGGRSPHSPRRRLQVTERHAAWRVERAAALLARAQQGRAHEHLVVAAPHELWPLVERTLHGDLRARLDGLVGPGLERASEQDITRAAGAVVARAEHEEHGRCAGSTTTVPSLRCERVDARPTTSRYTSGLSVPAGPPARTCTSGGGYAARTPGSRSSRGW
ncbi:MAG TPA: hypothetical protein VMU32_06650 [Solirubrobacteraceae bacterium]|nr:hypothetical protein [Solirubrobacteraceae bacterium]